MNPTKSSVRLAGHNRQPRLMPRRSLRTVAQGMLILAVSSIGVMQARAQSQPVNPSTSIDTAQAPSNAQLAQVSAATTNAVDRLIDVISQQSLGTGYVVGDLITQAQAQVALRQILFEGQQIGGPRWVTSQICQVRLDVKGQQVADVLRDAAKTAGSRVSIPQATIEHGLADLEDYTFSATGTSTAGSASDQLAPSPDNAAWASIPETTRQAAVESARRAAARQVINSLLPVEVSAGHPLSQWLGAADSPIGKSLENYLLSRPVSAVAFKDDLTVSITLSAEPEDVMDILQAALQSAGKQGPSLDAVAWNRLRAQGLRVLAPATGQASVSRPVATTSTVQVAAPIASGGSLIPLQAPVWAESQLTAEGAATFNGSALLTARAAERDAGTRLRNQVLALPLSVRITLGQAMAQSPAVNDAVNRALINIRPYKAEYFPDGHVQIRAMLDLSDLWEQLHRLP